MCALPFSAPGKLAAVAFAHPANLLCCLGIGFFCTILPYLCYSAGLAHMEASRAAILATVEPMVGALLGILVYHESAGPVKLLGMALIFAALVLLNGREKVKAAA